VCRQYDRLTKVDQGAIVECKRLAHVLELAQAVQAQRDNRSIGTAPSRTHRGAQVRTPRRAPDTKKQRELTQQDLEATMMALHEHKRSAPSIQSESVVGKR
jgi:isoaspartyl peptidase/L-asparaginase-like protein (Ntn-hydrolase superfamily)